MEFLNQIDSLNQLKMLSESNRHSILIEGVSGSGKTYIAKRYADMLNIPDFQIVTPKVSDIRDTIDTCYNISNPIVLCIENLDTGLPSASYTLLKFLEEPLSNTYIIVTCRNIKNIPDTIISRSEVVTLAPPTDIDIDKMAKHIDSDKYNHIKNKDIWKIVRTFGDVDVILSMNKSQYEYFDEIKDYLNDAREPISNLIWKLKKYPNGDSIPMDIVIKYIMIISNTSYMWRKGEECLKDLNMGRISDNAILPKLLFEYKYCE